MSMNSSAKGFTTVQEMFEEMNSGIRPQLEGMFTFIANNATCMTGLRTGDYEMFARACISTRFMARKRMQNCLTVRKLPLTTAS